MIFNYINVKFSTLSFQNNLSIQDWDKRYCSIFFPKIFLFVFQVSPSTVFTKIYEDLGTE